MRRSLGKVYPEDIQSSIASIGRNLDDFMASTVAYQMATDEDVSPMVRDLNARLVNEVIIVSDEISDEEARRRLAAIRDGVFDVQRLFTAAGVPIAGREPVATVEETAVIPRAQAEAMLAQFRIAWRIYPGLIERYGRIRPGLEVAAGLPIGGPFVAAGIVGLDQRINALDQEIFWAEEAFGRLEGLLEGAEPAVRIERRTFDRMRAWVAGVFQADETVKRIEGAAEKRAASPEPTVPGPAVPWWAIAAAGALAVAGILLMAEA